MPKEKEVEHVERGITRRVDRTNPGAPDLELAGGTCGVISALNISRDSDVDLRLPREICIKADLFGDTSEPVASLDMDRDLILLSRCDCRGQAIHDSARTGRRRS